MFSSETGRQRSTQNSVAIGAAAVARLMPRTRRQESKDFKMASFAIMITSSTSREQKTRITPEER